jgi:hypothetical protein
LTISSRERAARSFLAHIKTFATSIQSYVQDAGDVTVSDREDLRRKWESLDNGQDDGYSDGGYSTWSNSDDHDPLAFVFRGLGGGLGDPLYSMRKEKPGAKVNEKGGSVGIAPRLVQVSLKETNANTFNHPCV